MRIQDPYCTQKWVFNPIMLHNIGNISMNQAIYIGPMCSPRKKSENVREGQILELRVMPNNGAAGTGKTGHGDLSMENVVV